MADGAPMACTPKGYVIISPMQHKCIKPSCQNTYNDNEPEDYYCPSCLVEKKAIAARIDAQMAGKSREPVKSDLQSFEESARVFNDPNSGRQIFFGRA